MKFKRLTAGVYEVEGTDLQILKDGYEPVRDPSRGDGYKLDGTLKAGTTHHDHVLYGPEEVIWIVMRIKDGHEDNLGMFDTLREAKAWVARRVG